MRSSRSVLQLSLALNVCLLIYGAWYMQKSEEVTPLPAEPSAEAVLMAAIVKSSAALETMAAEAARPMAGAAEVQGSQAAAAARLTAGAAGVQGLGAAEVQGPVTADVQGPGAADVQGPEAVAAARPPAGAAEVQGLGATDVQGPVAADVQGPGAADVQGPVAAEAQGPAAAAVALPQPMTGAAEAEGVAEKVTTEAASGTSETVSETVKVTTSTVAPPGPECALTELQQCRNVEPRAYSSMRGTHYWVMYNFVEGDRRFTCDETVTYTTHGDFTFLGNLAPLVRRWRAPVSFGLYAPADDFVPSLEALAYLRACDEPLIRELVTFHIIFDVDKVPMSLTNTAQLLARASNCSRPAPWVGRTSYRKAKHLTYPVNVARNVARETVMTHFVLPSDVELYPSQALAEQFLAMVRRNAPVLCRPSPRVFVLSIFEVADKQTPPLRKDQLTTMLKNGTAIPFHKEMCATCHRLPKAEEWTSSKETQQMDVFHTAKRHAPFEKWEPIYICTNSAPAYDERLTWEGKMDKMGQGYTMCLQDYDFMILNDAFLVHKPGIKRHKPDKWRDGLAAKQRKFVISAARVELERIYGRRKQCVLK